MKWNNLSMSDKSKLMKLFLNNGINDLNQMRNIYNNGGDIQHTQSKDPYQVFVQSLPLNLQPKEGDNFNMLRYWELNENYSDLIGLREALYRHNIFNSMDGSVFTKEMLDKFRETGEYNRFLDYHTDQQIIDALNEVAQNNSDDTTHYAARGGHIFVKGGPEDKVYVPSTASNTGWIPEVSVEASRPEWQRGLTNYDWSRARQLYSDENGYLTQQGINFLQNISSKRNKGNNVKTPSLVSRVAHKINEHGNKTPEPQSYEQFRLENRVPLFTETNTDVYDKVRKDTDKIYRDRYGRNYPLFPNAEARANRAEIEDSLYREQYKKYLDEYNSEAHYTPAQQASMAAITGTGIALLPHLAAKVVGVGLTIPDQIYDWSAAIDEPKPSHTAHVVTDYAPYAAKLIPGKYDDVILNGLNLVGNTDDVVSSQDYNLFGWLDRLTEDNKEQ